MVDIDDLRDSKGSSSSSSKSGSSGSSESGNSGGSSQSSSSEDGIGEASGTFSVDEDDMVDPSDKVVSDTSKNWADDKGDMNYDAQASENFQQYANRQVKEVEELHENIHEMATNHMENFDEFTLYFHALFLNFAQNRVGIAETIQNQFGKSEAEAMKLTKKICDRAGEKEFMVEMLDEITENMVD